VYRLLFLDGELLDVLRSLPAHLTGDGKSTVEELIDAENDRRVAAEGAAGLSLVGVDLDTVFALARAGLRLSSVLVAGRTVPIGVVTNGNAAEDNETFRGEISPQLIAEARSAQDAVGLRLAGVDVITTDLARPLAETGGVINEVNGTPGLHHHYLVADPDRATRVAIPVLERLLSRDPGDGAGAVQGSHKPTSRRLSAS
jgi:cyanophycin synthetase